MNSDKEFHVGDLGSLTLLRLIWGIWTVLTAFLALFGILFIFIAIGALFIGINVNQCVFMGLMGVVAWVLFLSNYYITLGLFRLDYFRWKLLVIESGLLGIVLGFISLFQILDIDYKHNILLGLVGTGFCLVSLYLAFNVRDKFRKA